MATHPRLVVIGSANVDLTTYCERMPREGETIFGDRFELGWGGKGANQAVAARRCGAAVTMIARVGADLFGPATIQNFQAQGIDITHVRIVSGASSGVAPIFVDGSGQNRILVVKGANDLLRPEHVDEALPLIERAHTMLLQFEVPLDTVHHAIQIAKRAGVRCILNPAPAYPMNPRLLSAVDWLIPNETEAQVLAGLPSDAARDPRACARALVDAGIPRVIVTLGEHGVLVATRDTIDVMPGFRVPAVDTSGAGDAFVGSFATFLAEGLSEHEAVRRAMLYAALSTTGSGTQKSFVTRARLQQEWIGRL